MQVKWQREWQKQSQWLGYSDGSNNSDHNFPLVALIVAVVAVAVAVVAVVAVAVVAVVAVAVVAVAVVVVSGALPLIAAVLSRCKHDMVRLKPMNSRGIDQPKAMANSTTTALLELLRLLMTVKKLIIYDCCACTIVDHDNRHTFKNEATIDKDGQTTGDLNKTSGAAVF